MRKGLTILMTIAMMAILTSCVPLVLGGAGAIVGGLIIYDKRPVKVILQDRAIASEANTLISEDPDLKNYSHISVAAFNNVVLLVGQAQTPELRAHAYQLILSVRHVKKIYNEITISGVTTDLTRTNDTWITTKVKSALLKEAGLKSTQLKVVTEEGVVYLMGLVTHEEANIATDIARRIRGVRKVVKVFEYKE